MAQTEHFLPVNAIKDEHIQEISSMQNELSQIRYWKEKHSRFRQLVSELSEEARWLLTFSLWFTAHNREHRAVHASKYYAVSPGKSSNVNFQDFIRLIRQYRRKFITSKNEEPIIRFLSACSKDNYEFYLSLLSKTFLNSLPLQEVYDVLDLGCINPQDIYGSIEIVQSDIAGLTYPVAVTIIPDPEYKITVQSREPRRTFAYYQNKGKLCPTKDLLAIDSKYIKFPRYTLVGYSDIKEVKVRRTKRSRFLLYPVDYFNTFKEYTQFLKGRRVAKTPAFRDRINSLNKFVEANYLRQISIQRIGYAETKEELTQQIRELYPTEGCGFLLLTNNDTSRTGKALAIPVVNTTGTIETLWVEEGVPKGFHVWFNGKLVDVSFDFTGPNNALLNKPTYVNQTQLEFTLIKMGNLAVYLGKKIHWDDLQWKSYRHRSGAYIEKCVLCGGTDQPHKYQGLCKTCEINIRYYYKHYGVDTWITPSRKMRTKRYKSGWEPELLNMMQATFQDSYIEAREDGCWRFRYDQARAEHYQKYLETKRIKVTNVS